MNILSALLLGLIQGLCEFLPVSSSGHLVLFQNILGINEGALFFDTMLHVGTLAAVVAVYYKRLWELIKKPFQKKVYLLVLSTLVTAVIAFLFKDTFDSAFEGKFLGIGFLLTAVILTLNEKLSRGKKDIDHMKYTESLGVGFMQGVAIFPGVSRSGSTIAGARFFGLSKEAAAEYSFILSIPAILGSLVLQIPDVAAEGLQGTDWGCVIIGTLAAAVSGYFAIRWMLKLITKKSLKGFAIYVGVLGALVLCDQLIFNVFFTNPF
jgi:undecaprenyl-diphosphatase